MACGASYTSNPSYQAAVSSVSHHAATPSAAASSSAGNSTSHAAPSHSSTAKTSSDASHSSYSKPSYPKSSSYSGSHAPSATVNKPTSASYRSHSQSGQWPSVHRSNEKFVQLLPKESQFPDPKSLPLSMHAMLPTDQIVNFYPVHRKGHNYLRHCRGWLSDHQKPSSITDCIRKYTSGPNWYCTEVNMALAADSVKLETYGPYVKELKYSIGKSAMRFTGTVFRGEFVARGPTEFDTASLSTGADMSPSEINAYETMNTFFIPSFTSTSKSRAFPNKNTLIHVDISPEWSTFCMEVQPEHTKYPAEQEILFSCYNLYKYLRTEKSNGQHIIKLQLLNYNRYFDYRKNQIVNVDF